MLPFSKERQLLTWKPLTFTVPTESSFSRSCSQALLIESTFSGPAEAISESLGEKPRNVGVVFLSWLHQASELCHGRSARCRWSGNGFSSHPVTIQGPSRNLSSNIPESADRKRARLCEETGLRRIAARLLRHCRCHERERAWSRHCRWSSQEKTGRFEVRQSLHTVLRNEYCELSGVRAFAPSDCAVRS